ncbi:MAG: 4Fe-4S binding protein [Desulfobacterales bacterium]|jgi:NADH-quinone oxidoreductase subunit I|nr:4Fe-4S binding protein [Desulfobacterales bacterium]
MKRLFKTLQGLWSLAVGLKITGVELFKPWLTVHYPRQEVDNLATFRGHIELVPAADDPQTPRCIMCWKCVEICPSRCISLRLHAVGEGAEAGDPGLLLAPELKSPYSAHLPPPPDKIERVLDSYRLNYSLCSLCGLCVQSCPVEAIRFSRNAYLVGTTRQDFDLDLLARLRNPVDAPRPPGPRPPT